MPNGSRRRFMTEMLISACLLASACQPSTPTARPATVELVAVEIQETKAAEAPPPIAPAVSGTFAFANDSGGKILGRLLPPTVPAQLPATPAAAPKPRRGLLGLERPEVPTAAPPTTLPAAPPAKQPPLRPRPLPDNAPLLDMLLEAATPQRLELPAGERVRTPARDVNLPVELPTQARYQADRAPLEDPTAELSVEKANGRALPVRSTPAPFVRVNLPEPFEHRAAVKATTPEPPVVAPVPMTPK
jgi:hypothetical protein